MKQKILSPEQKAFLDHLSELIGQRHQAAQEAGNESGSYTVSLFRKGINKIAQKVGEEAIELVIEAKDNNEELFKNEAADLLFHYLVLLEAKGFSLAEIIEVLRERHQ
jgi:phosphoribosyl-ATP pyrophosphohydrolase/phosphoribosyl-AMP cyclohydrolase